MPKKKKNSFLGLRRKHYRKPSCQDNSSEDLLFYDRTETGSDDNHHDTPLLTNDNFDITDEPLKDDEAAIGTFEHSYTKSSTTLTKLFDNNLIKSTYKHKDMTKEVLIEKIRQQKVCINSLQHELDRNRREINRQILNSGIVVPDYQNQEIADLVRSCEDDIGKAYPNENSLQRLFWDQQIKFCKSGKNGMRWHPMIIRWCLYLRHKSSKAYDAMRDCGFVNLPSARTLFDYSHYIKSALGFQGDVVKMLHEEATKKGLYNEDEQYKCYVGILFDEIRVKEDLVYDKHL